MILATLMTDSYGVNMRYRNPTLSISVLLVTLTLHSVACQKKEEPPSESSYRDPPAMMKPRRETESSQEFSRVSPSGPLPSQVPDENKASSKLEAEKNLQAQRRIEAASEARRADNSRVEAARQSASRERIREPELLKERELKARSEIEEARIAREPAPSESGSKRDPFAAIDEVIQHMEKANIAFNAPKTMNRADTVMIQLLMSMTQATGELKELLKGKGEKESAVVPVAAIMEARLSGPNFEITATTPEEQPISRLEKTEWRWDVKSKSIGEHDLHLTLTAIFDVEGTQRKRAIRTFDQIITVNVTTGQQFADFVNGNWQWLWAAIAAPLVGAIWQSKRTKGKRTKR